jgi:hypothetical protein
MTSLDRLLDRIPPERRAAILQQAEQMIYEERVRRRSAPDRNRNAAAAEACGRASAVLVFIILIGLVAAIVWGQ